LGGVTIIAFFFCYPSRNGAQHDSPLRDKIISLDLIGTLILLSSAIMLFFALEFINTGEPWDSARIIGLLCGFGVTAVLFGVWLWWKQDAALIPPAILCQRTVAASCTMGFMIYGALLVHAYFLPIWFQGVLGTSALQSGVNMIPYFLANAISSVVAGAFVSRIGYYVPPCLAGNAIATVGCGLLTMLSPSTSTAQWVGFEIIVALGFGLSIQQGFTAVQTVLPANRVAIGTAAVVACQSLGGSIFISAGTTIFQGHLSKAVAGYKIPGVDAKTVIAAGATVFRESVPSEYLPAILREYNEALRKVFVSVIPLAGLSLVCSLFFEWKSVRGTKAT
jgi:MFS family permease